MQPDIARKEASRRRKEKLQRGKKSRYREEGDFGPSRIGMRKFHGDYWGSSGWFKWGPVKRFLAKHVGENWDDVYSEMCKEADSRTDQGVQFREWIKFTVELNVRFEDGKIVNDRGFEIGKWRPEFYVHPDTKKLEMTTAHRSRKKKDEFIKVFYIGEQAYHWHGGLWWRVKMTPIKYAEGLVSYYSSDQFIGGEVSHTNYYDHYARRRLLQDKYGLDKDGNLQFCSERESANGREIQQLYKLYNFQ